MGELVTYAPGQAWELGKASLADAAKAASPELREACLKEAERLCEHMERSDARLMRGRIADARANANGTSVRPCQPKP